MKMKKLMACAIIAMSISACEKIPAGYVGIKVNLLGNSKGVETEELGVGRYWIGINQELYKFPVFTQNYTWTREPDETGDEDESITFQTQEGLSVNADIGISYSIDPKKVNTLFQKYRKGIDEITDVYLRNMVRDAFVLSSSNRKVESVYGGGKYDLIQDVEKLVREQVKEIGINIERVYFAGELRLPKTVVEALNRKITAIQEAEQRKNEVEKQKQELAIEKLRAEADKIRGQALRNSPELLENKKLELQKEWIQKWNGQLPQTVLNDKSFMLMGQ